LPPLNLLPSKVNNSDILICRSENSMSLFCDILLKLKFGFQMLNNTISSGVALYVVNSNMEAGTCSRKYIFSRESNLCYPF